jgi:tRNA pseudouridine38-40 synthase
MARRYRLDIAYDGTEYAGWQVQPGQRTIQGCLEQALSSLQGGRAVRVRGAGRTDAGAHARAQVTDFLLECRIAGDELAYALRRMLPPDIRPRKLVRVHDSFNARDDALRKSYRYRLDLSRGGDPFLARYATHLPRGLDRGALSDALLRLPGRKDWSGFTGSKCNISNRVRLMQEARYDEEAGKEGWLTFTADGFLTHMVRNIVGTLLEIGEGKRAPESVENILAAGDRRQAGPTAPARGLYLWQVEY